MDRGPLIALALMALLFAVAVLRAVLGYRAVYQDAHAEWPAFQTQRPDLAKGMDKQGFVRAFVRAHGPRPALYSAIMLVLAAVLTPLIVMVLTTLYSMLIATPSNPADGSALVQGVQHQFRRDGPLVYAFFMFFGLIASWGLVAFVVARFYHSHRPGSLEDEVRHERGDAPLPAAPKARPRPKWSPLVQTKDGLRLPQHANKEAANKESE